MHSFLQVIVKRLVSKIRLQSWGLIGCIYNEIYGNSTTTLVDPEMYMCRVDIFSHYSLCFFLSYFFPKDFIIPHIIDNHMTDFPHHHSIMYDFTSLYSPVIRKDNFPLIYMYKSSRYYAVFHIDLGPMFPQSTSL